MQPLEGNVFRRRTGLNPLHGSFVGAGPRRSENRVAAIDGNQSRVARRAYK
jgi:hypothetical protein